MYCVKASYGLGQAHKSLVVALVIIVSLPKKNLRLCFTQNIPVQEQVFNLTIIHSN